MAALLVIADDLTGALDSGVQLTREGARVAVTCDWQRAERAATGVDVLVVDTESRHLAAADAYERVRRVADKAAVLGVGRIYKKCDSGLRGNVGAELAAVLDATAARRLDFVPAYPALGRITKGGVHFVDGLPLAEGVFAHDPLDAVTQSAVADIIHEESDVDVTSASNATDATEGIVVHDCASDADLARIGAELSAAGGPRLAAGCAGLLGTYRIQAYGDPAGGRGASPDLPRRLAVVSGSVNGVCRAQLDCAEAAGAFRAHLPLSRVLAGGWGQGEARELAKRAVADAADAGILIIDSLGTIGEAGLSRSPDPSRLIAQALGSVACELAALADRTLMIIGGDTLMGFFERCSIASIEPVREMEPGVVLARYRARGGWQHVITKSGAFGAPDLLARIQGFLAENEEELAWR